MTLVGTNVEMVGARVRDLPVRPDKIVALLNAANVQNEDASFSAGL